MSKTADVPCNLQSVYPIVRDLEPLLQYDDPFTLDSTDCHTQTMLHGPIQTAQRAGALQKAHREYYSETTDTGDWRWAYEWAEGVREHLLEYIEERSDLPCGCPAHIPDSRDDPAGVISCKHCGTEYDAERFKALVRGQL